MSWPTGDGLSSALVTVRFVLPADDWWTQVLLGSTAYLQNVSSWDDVGTVSPAFAAAEFYLAWSTAKVQALSTGQVVCFPADNMQYINQDSLQGASQWRKCDGSSLLKTSYQELFNVIGYTFGGSGANFNLPDLRGRVIVDAGSGAGLTPRVLADVFGEETHTLTIAEMPGHDHSYSPPGLPFAAAPVGTPVSTPNPFPGSTGSTGGDGAHNNIQPSVALFYYIQVDP